MQKSLFSKKALDKLQTPEELDTTLILSGTSNWLIIVGLLLITFSLLLWGFFGRISTTVNGEGIIMIPGGITRVMSMESGQIKELFMEPGDFIEEEDLLAEIHTSTGEVIPVLSNHTGRILEVFVYKGDLVVPGHQLLSMEVVTEVGEELEAILFLRAEEGQKVDPGMEAFIAPLMISTEEHGYLLGEVAHVSRFPSSLEGVKRVLGNEELAMRMVGEIIPVQVTIRLLPDDTPSGYGWTSGEGPDSIISSGMLCQGRITLTRESPIALVFPVLR